MNTVSGALSTALSLLEQPPYALYDNLGAYLFVVYGRAFIMGSIIHPISSSQLVPSQLAI